MYAFAGTCLFRFGMNMASEALQKLAANRIRDLLTRASDRPYVGIIVGILLTVVMQSSGAVTSMLVGLGSAGVINLKQVMSILLGTSIGTTITVQLLSLNVAQFGLPIFCMSFVVHFLNNKKILKNAMQVFMGFGLIFWGLELIGVGTLELRQSDWFSGILRTLVANPFITVIATSFLTAVVHSSAVTIGVAMALVGNGSITLADSLYWVYGANFGTTATALLASVGANYVGRQVAWAHCFYKLISVGVFYFFTDTFARLMSFESPMRDVANAHTVFNITAALMLYPFINRGSAVVEEFFKPSKREREFHAKYLDRTHFESLSVAMAHAQREVMRLGDIVFSMVRDSLTLYKNSNEELEESIQLRDTQADILHREINLYLTKFVDETNTIPKEVMKIISFASDLESVGDVIDNSLLEMARKKHALKLEFSEQGWKELEDLHRLVTEITELSLSCFQREDKGIASKLILLKRELRKIEKRNRISHIERIAKGRQESINTSSIHLDLLSEYRRIVSLMVNHAYSQLKEEDLLNLHAHK